MGGETEEAESKPQLREGQIRLKVQMSGSEPVLFKIKRTAKLKKLFDAYCQRGNLNPKGVRFLFEGNRLRDEHTPNEHEMEDDDVIDVMVEQQGGCQGCSPPMN